MSDKKELNPHISGRQLGLVFVAFFVVHAAVIYLANMFFPQLVVLGNHFFNPTLGLLYAVIPFTLVTVGSIPLIEHVGDAIKRKISNMEWMLYYFVINVAALWILARFAEWIGMGISSWLVVVVLGAIITFAQGMVIGMIMKPSTK